MPIKIGEINRLTVLRPTDIGYMLAKDNDEVFLHLNDSMHQALKPNDTVSAFIYYDNKGRVAATLKTPLITLSKPNWLKVTGINPDLGVFLEMGINKDLLLSKDDLPLNFLLWPEKDDRLPVTMKLKGRLIAKLMESKDITPTNVPLEQKSTVKATVIKLGKQGLNLLTAEHHVIFVHQSLIKGRYRIGQEVECKITYVSEKGHSGSLIEPKEVLMYDDANQLLSYLIQHEMMPFDADSDPKRINQTFNLSKKAFKRALGALYKQRKIRFADGNTYLINQKGENNE